MNAPLGRSRPVAATLALLVAAALAGCSGDDADERAAVTPDGPVAAPIAAPVEPDHVATFVATDHHFEGPSTVPAGLVEIMLDNRGAEGHQLALYRPRAGVEAGDVLAALAGAGHLEAGRELGEWFAGPNGAAPGGTASAIVELEPGRYLVACLVPSPDGTPHVAQGMLGELEVTDSGSAEPGAQEGDRPEAKLREYSFELPDGIGDGPVDVVNEGEEIHEIVVLRLHDGTTVNDLVDYEESPRPRGPEPYDMVTGTTFVEPGGRATLDLDLPAGEYVAICFIPDPAKTSHFTHGMVHPFTVS